jgi:hypothetical protein
MAIDRGNKLDTLDEKSQQLMLDSEEFQSKSRNVRRMMCKRNARFAILGGVIVAVVIGLIIYFAMPTKTTTT